MTSTVVASHSYGASIRNCEIRWRIIMRGGDHTTSRPLLLPAMAMAMAMAMVMLAMAMDVPGVLNAVMIPDL
jgi:hypothetical protein